MLFAISSTVSIKACWSSGADDDSMICRKREKMRIVDIDKFEMNCESVNGFLGRRSMSVVHYIA